VKQTIRNLIEAGEDSKPALMDGENTVLTYSSLSKHIDSSIQRVNSFGLGRGDRIAVVLPNGPTMASAFVTIASGATIAPLNPSYRYDEFEFYLKDLEAQAVVLMSGEDSEARQVAQSLSIPILELIPTNGAAGLFDLDGARVNRKIKAGPAEPDDVALILHTSGTTSRPKIVPLTQANLCVSAGNIAETLQLTDNDLCLNVMPLFHIHGLVAAVLSSLVTGGAVVCTNGFNALTFFSLVSNLNPSWYTAVPTMHQVVLSRAPRNRDIIENSCLRFIRSSSSSLPPQVMQELEETFKVPVIEAYGMTEAAHQMASNPLPPAERKPGSVGLAAGPEIAVLGEEGQLLGADGIGEIVIRGANVTEGYDKNPQANADAFENGWFRTGDQGFLDGDQYLTITGRLKEIINRGGEKISPREVDDVMMDHGAVSQVVTFACPHEKLGEEVAAAVVLREGMKVTERELQIFVGKRLAPFKVPSKIVFLDEIPKGQTGKLQRIGLAEKLGINK
jgi:acyl-CoA synthetase (AMP-forming)/AMP-acid ligase II